MFSKRNIDRNMIAVFCHRHQIKRLSLFGSILTDQFDDSSDIDVLVEFEDDAKVSLFDVGGMMHELTQQFGQQVDIRTPDDLSRYFRDDVVSKAEMIYAA